MPSGRTSATHLVVAKDAKSPFSSSLNLCRVYNSQQGSLTCIHGFLLLGELKQDFFFFKTDERGKEHVFFFCSFFFDFHEI